jgi:hypothetical protein
MAVLPGSITKVSRPPAPPLMGFAQSADMGMDVFVNPSYARCGIFGRSPLALPVIGGRGRAALPGSITKV